MHFAICDDEPAHIHILQTYFDARTDLSITSEAFESGKALVDDCKANGCRYDALFIDMEMPGMNGIDTANVIRAMDEQVIIVFVTSHEQYAPASFECGASRYLVKPLQDEKVNEALDFIAKRLSREKKTLSFDYNKEHIRLLCDDIIYCESDHNGSIIYTKNGSQQTRMTISELERILDSTQFCRVNRSCMVNLSYVKTVKSTKIILQECQAFVPLSRSYREKFDRAMVNFEEREYYG